MARLTALNVFEGNPSWRHQLVRLLAEVSAGGGDTFEILTTASRIRLGDEEDWYRRWHGLGTESSRRGAREEKKGHNQTARAFYLRAANYHRMSNFYLAPDDPRELQTYSRIVSSFQRASRYFQHNFQVVNIPFEGVEMPGYFLRAEGGGRHPAVILMGGADSVKEEYYFRAAFAFLERGMSCLLIDGPGQGVPLRKHKMYLRYDYEKPVSAMLDYLSGRRDVNPRGIGYVASSLGGYFVVRAAAFEKRIAAVTAWSACYDVLHDIYDFFPPIAKRIRFILGAKTDLEARRTLKSFNLRGVVEKVECPLLIVHGEDDYVCDPDGARRVYKETRSEKALKMYRKGELGALHAQQDSLDETRAFISDWMASKLA